MTEIGKSYMTQLGFNNAAFILVKHKDREHAHVHAIGCLIDINNNLIDRGYIGLRSRKIADKLEKEFGLQSLTNKNLAKTNLTRLNDKDIEKYKLYASIKRSIVQVKSFDQLQQVLNSKNIEMHFKYKPNSKDIQGVSFKFKESLYTFKGSQIDKSLSYWQISKNFISNTPHFIHQTNTISNPIESKGSFASNFFKELLTSGPGYTDNHYHSSTPTFTPDHETEEEKKKKRKRKFLNR